MGNALRLGLILPPQDPNLSVRQLVDLAVLAEAEGYHSVLTPEAFAFDAHCLMTACAAATSRIQLGTSIVTLPVRTPVLTAMGAITVDSLSGGRYIIGLGMGHRRMQEGVHGLDFKPQLQLMREYVAIVRSFIAGEDMAFRGERLRSTDGRVGTTPLRPRIPVYLAALMPGAVRLAGEVADGILPYYATPQYLARILELVAEGARSAGRDPGEVDIALMIPTWVTDDPASAREIARGQIAWYNNFEFYNAMFREAGFVDEADALRAAWAEIEADPVRKRIWEKSRDDADAHAGTASLVSDAMVDSVFAIGSAEECRARIAAWRAAGVTTPMVFPQGVYPTAAEAVEGFGRTVRALAGA